MPKAISWRKLIQNLRRLGFEGPYAGGKHLFMKRGTLKLHIPSKHKGEISAGLVSEIIRQAGIDKSKWNKI
ncbi:MAG TPA: type II toxin-antitoxin system HicA family toxin [Candidatus Portnoybacteria bacterium]|nr:type II toxin-antitoxin system HicA family toxin [Candidatus Portnoybacteria bacterium]